MIYAACAQPAAPALDNVNEIRAAGGFPERNSLNIQRGSFRPNAPALERLDVNSNNITIVDNDFDRWSIKSV